MNPSAAPIESPKPPLPPARSLPMADDVLLKNVRIASPCSVNWDAMPGGERVRSCAQCGHKVYNLSEMPAADAAHLLRSSEGRVCVRFYQRPDGTVMTKDCPVGLRALRQRAARAATLAFSTLFISLGGLSLATRTRSEQPRLLRWALDTVSPLPEPQPEPTLGIRSSGSPETIVPLIDAPSDSDTTRMGKAAPAPPMGRIVMGAVPERSPAAQGTSFDDDPAQRATVPPVAVEKPFLNGSNVDNAPRADPFARTDNAKK
jgi:hypothetical protein